MNRQATSRFRVLRPILGFFAIALLDGVCILSAFAASNFFAYLGAGFYFRHLVSILPYFWVFVCVWWWQAYDHRLYVSRQGDALVPQLLSFARTVFTTVLLAIFVLALLYKYELERTLALTFGCTTFIFMLFYRTTLRISLFGIRRRGYAYRRILLIGGNERSARVAQIIGSQRHYGYQIIGILDDDEPRCEAVKSNGIEYLGRVERLDEILTREIVDLVYISLPVKSQYERIMSIAHLCESVGVSVRLVAELFPEKLASGKLERFGNIPVLSLTQGNSIQPRKYVQRVLDMATSAAVLVVAAPVMIVAVIGIWIESRGPILMRGTDTGSPGRSSLRFRTGRSGGTGLTRTGRVLATSGLDELPGLFGVLLGGVDPVARVDSMRPGRPAPADVSA